MYIYENHENNDSAFGSNAIFLENLVEFLLFNFNFKLFRFVEQHF